jgi:hypothetical protein
MAKFRLTVEVGGPRAAYVPTPDSARAAAADASYSTAGYPAGSTAAVDPMGTGWSGCFLWPLSRPALAIKLLPIGLISLIPVAGQIVLLGWMMDAETNLSFNRDDLPWPRLMHLILGVRVVIVELVYFSACVVPLLIAHFLMRPGSHARLEWEAVGVAFGVIGIVLLPATLEAISLDEPFNLAMAISAVARRPAASVKVGVLLALLAAVLVGLRYLPASFVDTAPLLVGAGYWVFVVFLGPYLAAVGAVLLHRYVVDQV